jgi:glyoxylase-like metal-dependent hydrolase (beta-lactamase superfamily II)
MELPRYEVYALRYGTLPDRSSRQNYLHADGHDGPMPLDFFIWLVVGHGRTIVVDTGFGPRGAERRGRRYLCTPVEALRSVGVETDDVGDVILTHMHYDHAGNTGDFGRARFHVQDSEMAFCTGRCMCHDYFRAPMEAEDVVQAVRFLYAGRLAFHEGMGEVAPGVTVHHIGGHTRGLQIARVHTRRGWVVLASDGTHFWGNIRGRNPFPLVTDVAQSLNGYDIIESLADGPSHIIPGHDPEVLTSFPRWRNNPNVVRLD